jgi:hypothetical protein
LRSPLVVKPCAMSGKSTERETATEPRLSKNCQESEERRQVEGMGEEGDSHRHQGDSREDRLRLASKGQELGSAERERDRNKEREGKVRAREPERERGGERQWGSADLFGELGIVSSEESLLDMDARMRNDHTSDIGISDSRIAREVSAIADSHHTDLLLTIQLQETKDLIDTIFDKSITELTEPWPHIWTSW